MVSFFIINREFSSFTLFGLDRWKEILITISITSRCFTIKRAIIAVCSLEIDYVKASSKSR